jgi:hypothetical protein
LAKSQGFETDCNYKRSPTAPARLSFAGEKNMRPQGFRREDGIIKHWESMIVIEYQCHPLK